MTEPETLPLLEVKGPEAPEKSPPQVLIPNGGQPEGEGGAESPGAESSGLGSSAGSPTAGEGTEDGLDSTVSEAATLPWGTGPQPSAPFPDPPGWRDIEPEPLESEPPTKLEELPEDDASLLPEKAARAFVPIDLQCIERRPQEDLVVCCEAGEGLLVYGLSLLCFSALRPFGEPRREVEIHRQYVAQSVQLFILYFFNLAVLSTYLPQETLKLLPLLTGLFAISREEITTDWGKRVAQADILADLRCGPLLSRLWLRPDVPAPAVHADVEPLLHVRGGARAHAHCGREPPGLPRPRPLGLGLQAPPLGLSRSAPPSCPQPGNSVGQTSLLSNRGPPDPIRTWTVPCFPLVGAALDLWRPG
ncbi:transmembrane protein 79 isoform X3 [Equus przewalskii]|uniref:Transmembrane protein 79 isoform X3 n=1 Tax=Equus przewalskii TaxID=9798 RepID=A0ABM4NIE4_EQUPR|nr:transmembrane protein 79 isoform X3 [Equus caballus]